MTVIEANKQKEQLGLLKKRILCKTNKRCAYCGKELTSKEVTIDHIVPLNRGTLSKVESQILDKEANMIASCHSCNTVKTNKSLHEFKQMLVYKHLTEGTPLLLDLDYKFYFETLIEDTYFYTATLVKGDEKQTIQLKAKNCKEVMTYCNKHFRSWEVKAIQFK